MWLDRLEPALYSIITFPVGIMTGLPIGMALRYSSVRDCLEVSPTISYKGPKFMVFTVLYKSDGGGGI